MWTRALLKANAKTVLRRSYWRVFLMCLIASLLAGKIGLNFNTSEAQISYQDASQLFSQLVGGNLLFSLLGMAFAMVSAMVLVLILAVSLCWGILFTPVIRVGQCRYLIQNRAGAVGLDTLFSGFAHSYWNTVSGMFYANLRIFLYFLLLIVPGIIKRYQYIFVPFLLAENPDLDPARAAEISTLMTDGEKWNIFVLDLSFLGWNILGSLLFGIGTLFVTPYYSATQAELYAAMRAKALAAGIVSEAELSGETF